MPAIFYTLSNKFKIIFFIIFIQFLFSASALASDSTDQIIDTYDKNDLASKPPFKGGFINFGYWKNVLSAQKNNKLSEADRAQASLDLYKYLISHLNIQTSDKILEVGCGLGFGCKYLNETNKFSELTCIDITPRQIERARILHKDLINQIIKFEVGSADNIKQPANSLDKIYSVEAAQYFPSMKNFASEAFRVLKPGGTLAIVAHYSTSEIGYENTKKLLPTVAHNIDKMIPINQVRDVFVKSGFKEIKFEPIGQNVFKGFDMWISQVEDEPWAHNIYKLYLNGDIDYYLIVLQK